MVVFNVDEFIEIPNVEQLKKLIKDQLLELSENLGVMLQSIKVLSGMICQRVYTGMIMIDLKKPLTQ